ncbi:hypothetical protein ALT_3579 [Aspergillus lentulus]|uniref:Uncharacterized protein n=1 Tax=Aspergillus lentulus TaxID=293939 RepID=A0AAN4PHM3_ASPLE|nr:hypothetical protein ALT_3579 [Aspergillus lentulus]
MVSNLFFVDIVTPNNLPKVITPLNRDNTRQAILLNSRKAMLHRSSRINLQLGSSKCRTKNSLVRRRTVDVLVLGKLYSFSSLDLNRVDMMFAYQLLTLLFSPLVLPPSAAASFAKRPASAALIASNAAKCAKPHDRLRR